jgi:RNA polymerase sigma factor (sigma-70 family)
MGTYTEDEQLLQQLHRGDQKALKDCYHQWEGEFLRFIARRFGCELQDAREVYPETMSRFYFNCVDGKLKAPLQSSLKTYAFGIGKNLFHKRFLDTYREKTQLDDEFPDAGQKAEVLDLYEYREQKKLVHRLLDLIGEPCKKLLELIYIYDYANDAVARELDIPTEGAVRKRKFDCLKKMKKLMG